MKAAPPGWKNGLADSVVWAEFLREITWGQNFRCRAVVSRGHLGRCKSECHGKACVIAGGCKTHPRLLKTVGAGLSVRALRLGEWVECRLA